MSESGVEYDEMNQVYRALLNEVILVSLFQMERTLGSCRQGLMACSQDVGED